MCTAVLSTAVKLESLMQPRFTLRPVVVAAALFAAGAAQASVDVYSDEASFLAAISNYATDTFEDLIPGMAYDGPLVRSAGSVGYTVSTTPNSPILYGAGDGSDAWLSSNIAGDFVIFEGFSQPIYAIGAYAFGSDISGLFQAKGLTAARVTTGEGTTTDFTFRAGIDNYFGFVSSTPITMFEIKTFYGQNNITWPTIDDLTVAAVPEPGTYALLLAGLAAVGFVARRRS
jgi:hypothetical protein